MASPPASSAAFERAFTFPDQQRASSQPPSRRESGGQQGDAPSNNAGSLDVPYQPQSSSWETIDFGSARTNSPGFPYTPSYRDSFTPYGSDSGLSWSGREPGANQMFDEPGDNPDVEYNPADFDGPGSTSNAASPYFLEGDPSGARSGMGSEYMSSATHGFHGDQSLNQQISNNGHLSPGLRGFSSDGKQPPYNGTPHGRMNSLDVNSFSPRPMSAASPASSVGNLLDNERPRSRASSVSSVHQSTPSLTVGPMGDAFDKLGIDPVDSDLLWRNQQSNQTKVQSPPQLFIPHDAPSSTLQIPGFGNNQQTLGTGLSTGGLGLSAPGINILPATPVSGGAGASNVPFQQVLQNLNERRRASGSGEELGVLQSHGK